MSEHQAAAVELLQHYFALAMGKRSAAELPSDYRAELASIVEHIMKAAVDELRRLKEGA